MSDPINEQQQRVYFNDLSDSFEEEQLFRLDDTAIPQCTGPNEMEERLTARKHENKLQIVWYSSKIDVCKGMTCIIE
ncbi:hypothetical protein F2P81_008097 [Scophthalmus maximus]|uniref:Uncharacterized protein n=1 Tax=Scophthalmus maximus TaxID=52904 RepID=A0A6A4TCF2_SCOMX|nr:hypothetical protein F2P81_008097 [Scophthalmus maximus]